jgi:hypothetical protein
VPKLFSGQYLTRYSALFLRFIPEKSGINPEILSFNPRVLALNQKVFAVYPRVRHHGKFRGDRCIFTQKTSVKIRSI